jgi:hypothetical protein
LTKFYQLCCQTLTNICQVWPASLTNFNQIFSILTNFYHLFELLEVLPPPTPPRYQRPWPKVSWLMLTKFIFLPSSAQTRHGFCHGQIWKYWFQKFQFGKRICWEFDWIFRYFPRQDSSGYRYIFLPGEIRIRFQ